MDYYRILQVNRNASPEDIKKAYRQLSRRYHPDNAGEVAKEQFEQVQEAYAVLGNQEKRFAYDRKFSVKEDRGQQEEKDGQAEGHAYEQENNYRDLAAFYQGAYQNSFEKFFYKNLSKVTGEK